ALGGARTRDLDFSRDEIHRPFHRGRRLGRDERNIVPVYTRFPFGIVVGLNSRMCRKLKRENAADVRSSYVPATRSHRARTNNIHNKKPLESYELVQAYRPKFRQ
ncbi:unnamed protein product, partial [Laminaria digitata]